MSAIIPNPFGASFSVSMLGENFSEILPCTPDQRSANPIHMYGPGYIDQFQGTEVLKVPTGSGINAYYALDCPSNGAGGAAGIDGPRANTNNQMFINQGCGVWCQFIEPFQFTANTRLFWGLTNDGNGFLLQDPSNANAGYVGIGCDSTDGFYQVMNKTSGIGMNKQATTLSKLANPGYYAIGVVAAPLGTSVTVTGTYLEDGTTTPILFANKTISTNLPTISQGCQFWFFTQCAAPATVHHFYMLMNRYRLAFNSGTGTLPFPF
jgi:hypothetical protein